MSLFNVVRPIVRPIVRSIVNPRGGGFAGLLNLYPGAAAAYSLRALSSGWLAGDVVEVRPSHGAAAQSFTASQITSGAMLDFVNGGTTDLYDSARYFNENNTELSSTTLGSFYTDNDIFEVEFTVYANQLSSDGFVFSIGDDANNGIHFTNQLSTGRALCEFIVGGVNVKTIRDWEDGTYKITANKTLGTFSVVNPDLSVTNSVSGGQTFGKNGNGELNVGFRYSIGSRTLNGTVYNITLRDENLADVLHWSGLGTSATAWEDTIGSNDGTETNGAAYTGQPFDGFVSKWYDQSGNANNAIQVTTTAQPKIVSAGALVTDSNGRASVQFDGGVGDDDGLLATIGAIAQPFTAFSVSEVFALSHSGGIWGTTSPGVIDFYRSTGNHAINAGASVENGAYAINTSYVKTSIFNGASSSIAINGSNTTGLAAGSGAIVDSIYIGRYAVVGTTLDGIISELIIYSADKSSDRVGIEAIMNNYYGAF